MRDEAEPVMPPMDLSPSRRNVRRLAREYRMPESDVREMLAIESGRSRGDVVFADDGPPRSRFRRAVDWCRRLVGRGGR